MLRKWVANNVVVVLTGLPNLAITTGTLFVLTQFFHVYPVFAYLVGQVFSVQWAVGWQVWTKGNFTLLGRGYRFGKKPDTDTSV